MFTQYLRYTRDLLVASFQSKSYDCLVTLTQQLHSYSGKTESGAWPKISLLSLSSKRIHIFRLITTIERTLDEKHKILPVVALILALFCWCYVYSLHSLTLWAFGWRNCSSEGSRREEAALVCSCMLGKQSLLVQRRARFPESVYPTADTFQAIYGYDSSDDGTGLFILFWCSEALTWTADADGQDYHHPCWQRWKLYSNCWFLRPDDHWRLWTVPRQCFTWATKTRWLLFS